MEGEDAGAAEATAMDGVHGRVAEAVRLVGSADLLLLDFDGPVTRLFPGDEWRAVSQQLREVAIRRGGRELETVLAGEADHVQVLRLLGEHRLDLVPSLEAWCARLELAAASRARAEPLAVTLMLHTLARGKVAIVTNNAPGVVRPVLEAAYPGLTNRLSGVHGRSPGRVDDLKPRPDLLLRALAQTGLPPQRAVLIGDSVSDVQAGMAVQVPVVGVHEDADRRAELVAAGAVAALSDLGPLLPPAQPPRP